MALQHCGGPWTVLGVRRAILQCDHAAVGHAPAGWRRPRYEIGGPQFELLAASASGRSIFPCPAGRDWRRAAECGARCVGPTERNGLFTRPVVNIDVETFGGQRNLLQLARSFSSSFRWPEPSSLPILLFSHAFDGLLFLWQAASTKASSAVITKIFLRSARNHKIKDSRVNACAAGSASVVWDGVRASRRGRVETTSLRRRGTETNWASTLCVVAATA